MMAAPAVATRASTVRSKAAKKATGGSGGGVKPSRRKSCEHPSCQKQPAFSYNGSGVRFCAQHRLDGMVNVRNRRCEGEGCTKEPYFGQTGGKARFCATHKPDENMVDVRHRRCDFESCTKQPNYGYEGERACFCSTHKLATMVDVKHRRCAEPRCRGYSSFAFPGSKVKFCVEHRREGMVVSGRGRSTSTGVMNNNNRSNRSVTVATSTPAMRASSSASAASSNGRTASAPTMGARRKLLSPLIDTASLHERAHGSAGALRSGRGSRTPADDDEARTRGYKRRGNSLGSLQQQQHPESPHLAPCSSDDDSTVVATSVDKDESDIDGCGDGRDGGRDRRASFGHEGADDDLEYRRRSCPAAVGATAAAIVTRQHRLQQNNLALSAPQSLSSSPVSQQREPRYLRSADIGRPGPSCRGGALTSAGAQASIATTRSVADDHVQPFHLINMDYCMPRPVKNLPEWSTLPYKMVDEQVAPHGNGGCGGERLRDPVYGDVVDRLHRPFPPQFSDGTPGAGRRARHGGGDNRGTYETSVDRCETSVNRYKPAADRYETPTERYDSPGRYDASTSGGDARTSRGSVRGDHCGSAASSNGAQGSYDVASTTSGVNASGIGDARGGGYPAQLPPRFAISSGSAGGAPNSGCISEENALRDNQQGHIAEVEAPASAGGGGERGTWAEDALVRRQLPNMESLSVSTAFRRRGSDGDRTGGGNGKAFGRVLPSLPVKLRGILTGPPPAVTGWGVRLPGRKAYSEHGEGRNGHGATEWGFSVGVGPSGRGSWPSPVVVRANDGFRRGVSPSAEVGGFDRSEGRGRSVSGGGEDSPKRMAPSDDRRPESGRWSVTGGGNTNDRSVVTLNNGPKKRLVTFDRGSGTLETLEPR